MRPSVGAGFRHDGRKRMPKSGKRSFRHSWNKAKILYHLVHENETLSRELEELKYEITRQKSANSYINENVDERRHTLEHSDVVLVNTHRADRCQGSHCTIHNMSDHTMRSYPQLWRGDRGLMERVCPHGVGHPDPDDPKSSDYYEWVHGCDGCCAGAYPYIPSKYELDEPSEPSIQYEINPIKQIFGVLRSQHKRITVDKTVQTTSGPYDVEWDI